MARSLDSTAIRAGNQAFCHKERSEDDHSHQSRDIRLNVTQRWSEESARSAGSLPASTTPSARPRRGQAPAPSLDLRPETTATVAEYASGQDQTNSLAGSSSPPRQPT